MMLSKEQKEKLAQDLSVPWGRAKLICDGRRISLEVHRFKQMNYRVMMFIDGTFKHAWAQSSPAVPEHKFLRKSVRPNVSPAQRKRMEKKLGKRYVAKDSFLSGSYAVFLPDWASGKAAINHLCKVCESVEIAPVTKPEGSALDPDSPVQRRVLSQLGLD